METVSTRKNTMKPCNLPVKPARWLANNQGKCGRRTSALNIDTDAPWHCNPCKYGWEHTKPVYTYQNQNRTTYLPAQTGLKCDTGMLSVRARMWTSRTTPENEPEAPDLLVGHTVITQSQFGKQKIAFALFSVFHCISGLCKALDCNLSPMTAINS